MVPPIQPNGAETILKEAAELIETVRKNRSAGPLLVGLFLTLSRAFNDLVHPQNQKRLGLFLEKNSELVNRAEASLNQVQLILVEMKLLGPQQVEHYEAPKNNYDDILEDAANCLVMAEKAGKLFDELSRLRDRERLQEYLKKYRSVSEEFARYVRPYLKYQEDFRKIMRDVEFVKGSMDKIRKALGGLERLRRAINLLLDIGVIPTGYEVKQLKNVVSKELPSAA